jgi:translation elongation factor P/translation initiation factor 5A
MADLEKDFAKFSWNDGDTFTFFDSTTFEELQISKEDIPDADLLYEGLEVKVVKFGNVIVSVMLPTHCTYDVVGFNEGKKE